MNVLVFYSFWNIVVSTSVVINWSQQMQQSAYTEAPTNVDTYNLNNNYEVTINHAFSRSCFCVNVMRNKESSWNTDQVNGKITT